ncbi:MAG: hypothetical protein IH963_08870 [Chloroflexi bacterium]|nr:hypothetical protein [Chloroflexota bacterium]
MKLPGAVYVALLGILFLGALGLAGRATFGVLRRSVATRPAAVWLLMTAMLVALWASNFWSSYTLDGNAMQGRYVFPAFLPFVALLALGLAALAGWFRHFEAVMVVSIPVMIAANMAYVLHVVVPDVVAFRV